MKKIALHIKLDVYHQADLEELISAGNLGLAEAMSRWHPNGGGTIQAYAAKRIKGEMIDYLRRWKAGSRNGKAAKFQDTFQLTKNGAVEEYSILESLPAPDRTDYDLARIEFQRLTKCHREIIVLHQFGLNQVELRARGYKWHDIWQFASNYMPASKSNRTKSVTARQLEVLQELSNGHKREVAARNLNMSLETVKSHLKHVTIKLNANSTLHAVAIALREGLIK